MQPPKRLIISAETSKAISIPSSAYIREIPFPNKGFGTLLGKGFELWIEELNKFRYGLELMPLGPDAAVKLWLLIIPWFFARWSPKKQIFKTQKALDAALRMCNPEDTESLDNYYAELRLDDMSYPDLKHFWEKEDFHNVIEFLEETAKEDCHKENFVKDKVSIYTKPLKPSKQPEPELSRDEVEVIRKKLSKLRFGPRYRVKKQKKKDNGGKGLGASSGDVTNGGSSGGGEVEMGGLGTEESLETTLVLRGGRDGM